MIGGHIVELGDRLGILFWITGLSGAGKTSIAARLREQFRAHGQSAILLDGDVLREIIGPRFGHDPEDRHYLAMCYARLCRELTDQGFDVICATISMFESVRAWNRVNIPGCCEIYVRVPHDERRRRDRKGIYSGQDSCTDPVEFDTTHFKEPDSPDLIIDNHGDMSITAAAQLIWQTFLDRKNSR